MVNAAEDDRPAGNTDQAAPRRRDGYEAKRRRILDAATILLNERGLTGMTFQDVAQRASLKTTSVIYYFRFKELLAAAVFDDTMQRLARMIADAAGAPSPRERVERYVSLYFADAALALRGQAPPLAILSEIRALDDSYRLPLLDQYQRLFRAVRDLFGPDGDPARKLALTARVQLLNEALFWSVSWLPHYSLGDFPAVRRRLLDVLEGGIAREPGEPIAPLAFVEAAAPPTVRLAFMRAATRLINQFGYKGTSVDRIMADMGQTKGSFYHHLEGKDDLILECYHESYRRLGRIQVSANAGGGSQWQKLAAAIASVLALQFDGSFPMLRSTALQAMPGPLRDRAYDLGRREALWLAGALADGMQDGSVRPLDQMIAAHVIMSTINSAYDIRGWASRQPVDLAASQILTLLAGGIFD